MPKFQCAECCRLHDDTEFHAANSNGKLVCDSCAAAWHSRCVNCENRYPVDEVTIHPESGEQVCKHCMQLIRSYRCLICKSPCGHEPAHHAAPSTTICNDCTP